LNAHPKGVFKLGVNKKGEVGPFCHPETLPFLKLKSSGAMQRKVVLLKLGTPIRPPQEARQVKAEIIVQE